ncbi:MAG: AraC family transcriptional regulator [Coprococcus sp.]
MAYTNSFSLFPNERYMDLTLVQYGLEQCPSDHTYGPAIRNHYLFHYVISGKGWLQSTDKNGEDHVYHLSGGSGFLICPGQVNTYKADHEHPWCYCWLEFDGLKCPDVIASTGLGFNAPIYRSINSELREQMKQEMLSIIYANNASSLYLIAHLYQFLDLFVRSSASHTRPVEGKLKDLYIREATTFVEHYYHHSGVTIKDMAAFCNLNQNYLAKIFRETLHQTPQQFLIYFRMNKAMELLKYTTLPIGEISHQVGYPNQLNFSRAFKKVTGLSPQNWRSGNQHVEP